ncbi:MAG: T9SS type A sorting domain-containing protein [Candidatus Marinimicrobia bacterium]|nr:T9SS type A sorting domain-containing protein [Candidatus Neomarinimicrobiota bacterium]MDD5540803.1 T9SS type A sorting domain-containing protein [Candidatus Neomarinimicrobiota bacterium]
MKINKYKSQKKTTSISVLLGVLFLSTSLLAEKGFHLIGTMTRLNDGDRYMEVQGIGDINADGYKDFAIGASWETNAIGYADIYLGGPIIDTIPDYHLTVEDSWGFGSSITSGDFNADGFSDLVVADYCYSNYEYLAGRVFIYWGGADFDTIPDLIIECHGYMFMFGREVKNGGDVNGNGVDDLLISAPAQYTTRGYVIICYGGTNMDAEIDVILEGGMWDLIGDAICGIGDINADGYDDMLIGTHYQDATETYGRAYLMYGGSSIGTYFDTIYESDTTNYSFGSYVGNLGDITGDTISEYAISSPTQIRIYSGRNIKNISTLNKGELICNFASICNPVDINNDSINDVIIGMVGWQGNNLGAFVYLGGADFDSIPDYVIQGEKYEDGLGYTIASIGDINNDGQQELLIGGMSSNERGIVCLYTFGEWQGINETTKTATQEFKLCQNYPNPFNPKTTISFDLPEEARVEIVVYDLIGREIWQSTRTSYPAGTHSLVWNGTTKSGQPVGTGVYLVRLNSPKYSATQKVLLIK